MHEGRDLIADFLHFGLVPFVSPQVDQQLLLNFKGFPALVTRVPVEAEKEMKFHLK